MKKHQCADPLKEKLFNCEICQKVFSRKSSLIRNQHAVHQKALQLRNLPKIDFTEKPFIQTLAYGSLKGKAQQLYYLPYLFWPEVYVKSTFKNSSYE